MIKRQRDDGHYHVDVFAGPTKKFVRGFTLLSKGGGWVVYDEIGLLGKEQAISDPLPLSDALRTALAKLYQLVEKPVVPVWNSAPFDLLGYDPGTLMDRLFRREQRSGMTVGPDGLPAS